MDQIDEVTAATVSFFANSKDPKANIITTYNLLTVVPVISLLVFYNAPTPPSSGLFDEFLAIPTLNKDISTRSFKSLVLSSPVNTTAGLRYVSVFLSWPFYLIPISIPVEDASILSL